MDKRTWSQLVVFLVLANAYAAAAKPFTTNKPFTNKPASADIHAITAVVTGEVRHLHVAVGVEVEDGN